MAQKKKPAPAKKPVEVAAKTPQFRIGDIGKDVMAFQEKLGVEPTGIYDIATHKKASGNSGED